MASALPNLDVAPSDIAPAAIYGSDGPVRLRIATGGGGQTGLLRALAEAFIAHLLETSESFRRRPYRIAWIATDTSLSFNALSSRAADISFTYHPYASLIAVAQGIVERREYAWRDAFMLVGPKSNPASLPQAPNLSIYELFALLFITLTSSHTSSTTTTAAKPSPSTPLRFLSRHDKSANNILECRLWTTIGQTPWSEPYSSWYHRFPSFPAEALQTAALLGEYTLTDRGTWYSAPEHVREAMIVFKEGSVDGHDTADQSFEDGAGYRVNDDGLGNPAHVLLGRHAVYKEEGERFVEWLAREDGGRKVIRGIEVGGVRVYGLPVVVEPRNVVEEEEESRGVIDLS